MDLNIYLWCKIIACEGIGGATSGRIIAPDELKRIRKKNTDGLYKQPLAVAMELRKIVFAMIPELKARHASGDPAGMKNILVEEFSGNKVRFIAVFSDRPLTPSIAPYYKGSMQLVLSMIFPECEWDGTEIENGKRKERAQDDRALRRERILARAREDFYWYLEEFHEPHMAATVYEKMYQDSPERFAPLLLSYVNAREKISKYFGHSVLYKENFKELLQGSHGPKLSWRKILVFIWPCCFNSEKDVDRIAHEHNISVLPVQGTGKEK